MRRKIQKKLLNKLFATNECKKKLETVLFYKEKLNSMKGVSHTPGIINVYQLKTAASAMNLLTVFNE
jgi:hypothetical protein